MNRRTFLGTALAAAAGSSTSAAPAGRWDGAADALDRAVAAKQVDGAVLHVVHKGEAFSKAFGKAASADAMFLLGSISKPICVTALMTLFDRGQFKLDDPVKKFLPQFKAGLRADVTMQHLLTHVSGLPDQLPENDQLRRGHASLGEFVEHTI